MTEGPACTSKGTSSTTSRNWCATRSTPSSPSPTTSCRCRGPARARATPSADPLLQVRAAVVRDQLHHLGAGPGHARMVQPRCRLAGRRHRPQRHRQGRRGPGRRLDLRRARRHDQPDHRHAHRRRQPHRQQHPHGAAWPNGSGYTHYKWRLDGGAWSAETPIATPISLTGLANGPHYVEVVGKNDAGHVPERSGARFDATVTRSHTWTVDTGLVPGPSVRINEVLADNAAAVPHNAAPDVNYPDVVELYNNGLGTMILADMSLSDDPLVPRKFVFAAGTTLGPRPVSVALRRQRTRPRRRTTWASRWMPTATRCICSRARPTAADWSIRSPSACSWPTTRSAGWPAAHGA